MVAVPFQHHADIPVIHPDLSSIFGHVSRVNPSDWMSGGELRYDEGDSGLFAAMSGIADADLFEARRIRRLYTAPSGDAIGCSADGTAVLCRRGHLETIGPIADFLDLYFELLLVQGDSDRFRDIISVEKLVLTLKERRRGA